MSEFNARPTDPQITVSGRTVLGTDGKADRAIQSRIRLVAARGGVVAQVAE